MHSYLFKDSSANNNNNQTDAVTGTAAELAPPTASTVTEISAEVASETVTLETLPTTPDNASQSTTSHVPFTRQLHNATVQRNVDNAVVEYQAAAKLLAQRHAALGEQPTAPEEIAAPLPSGKPVQAKRGRSVSLPARMPAPEHHRQQPQTANDACEGYQRRQLIRDIAYGAAVHQCEVATAFIDRINAHSAFKARHPDTPDVTLYFEGVLVHVSQLGSVEWKWISRFNAARSNSHHVERRLMGPDDCEIIFTQLFPTDTTRLYNLEHFEVFVTGLGEEGIITKRQARNIVALAVTPEELDGGAHYTPPPGSRYDYRNDPSAVALFDMPQQPSRSITAFSNGHTKYRTQDLFYHLRILAEAAAYNQKFWRGYFIPNARSLIRDFHEAYTITQDGWSVPPHLTASKRPWTYREVRLLQRAHLAGRLLDMWDAGQLTDFGIVRAVRGTYIHLPLHAFWSVDELQSFLYARVADSGLPVGKTPEILALHPENDAAFSDPHTRAVAMRALVARAAEFEEEEEARLSQIEKSLTSFESALKAQMTPWQRVVARIRKVCHVEEKLAPFDPFAPEHEIERVG